MNALDYYSNPEIVKYIESEVSYIKSYEDREDCQQEIWAELYDFMPLNVLESKRLIKRVAEKFKNTRSRIYQREISMKVEP
jgi:hypothetical protein